jgi:hypothetical protein
VRKAIAQTSRIRIGGEIWLMSPRAIGREGPDP